MQQFPAPTSADRGSGFHEVPGDRTMPSPETQSMPTHNRILSTILLALGGYAGFIAVLASVLFRILPASPRFEPIQVTLLYGVMWMHGIVALAALFGHLLTRRYRFAGPMSARMLLAASVLFMVASVDQVIGVYCPPPDRLGSVLQPHPTRGWSHRPGAVGNYFGQFVRINSLGLREREFPLRKPKDEFRILFVGDSIAVGIGLPAEDTFVRQVESRLNTTASLPTIRTINAGCNGYTTWQQTDYLQSEGLHLDPDLIVLCFCLNDVIDVIDAPSRTLRGKPWIVEYPPLNHFSGLVRMAAHINDTRRAKIIREQHLWTHQDLYGAPREQWIHVTDLFKDPPPKNVADAWNQTFEDLEEFNRVCTRSRTPWVLLSFPIASKLPPDAPARKITRRLHEWAANHDVPALDVTDALESWRAEQAADIQRLFIDQIHPSAEGSLVIADAIHCFLEANQLVPQSASRLDAAAP